MKDFFRKFDIVIVSSHYADIPYVLKLINKIKNKKFLILTSLNFKKNIVYKKLSKNENITFIRLSDINFNLAFSFKSYLFSFLKNLKNVFILLNIRLRTRISSRFYFFNEFNKFENFMTFSFFKTQKKIFINPLRYLKAQKVTFQKLKEDFYNQDDETSRDATNNYLNRLKLALLFQSLFCFNQISFAYFVIDTSFFRKKNFYYSKDYYKSLGFMLNRNYKVLKIKPHNIKCFKRNKKKSILFLFTPVSAFGSVNINMEKSYMNMLLYFKKINASVDIKLHPNYKEHDDQFLKKLSKQNAIKILPINNPSEIYIHSYRKIIVTNASNSISNYLYLNRNCNKKIISLLKLIDFKEKETLNKAYQINNILFYSSEKFLEFADFKKKITLS